VLHYTLRKRFLEDVTRDALGDGFGQVVVLGAGLDTLAARLHRDFPAARFIEVDHPATQRVKRAALELCARAAGNLHLLPVDFTEQTLAQALAAHPAYRPDTPTLFIAEGVLMYLADRDVGALLDTVRSHGGPRSRIAFTFLERTPDGHIADGRQSGLVTAWLRRRGEPYRWALAPGAAKAFLDTHGLTLRELCTPECARERYFPRRLRPDLPLGVEHLCVADYTAGA
jgi:methyltransferase (TIGR00027 family)